VTDELRSRMRAMRRSIPSDVQHQRAQALVTTAASLPWWPEVATLGVYRAVAGELERQARPRLKVGIDDAHIHHRPLLARRIVGRGLLGLLRIRREIQRRVIAPAAGSVPGHVRLGLNGRGAEEVAALLAALEEAGARHGLPVVVASG